jgi:hypothetical protein
LCANLTERAGPIPKEAEKTDTSNG